MKDLISVIVPIYNVAPYVRKCIQSICNQTYKNLEIILVDDGSEDGSALICDEMARVDSRIVVIHQENGKLTRARKAGMRMATGKYVGFVDGDDWIEPNMYEVLYEDAVSKDVPIVLSGLYRENDEGIYSVREATCYGSGLFSGDRLIDLKNNIRNALNWSSCNKLFLKELVSKELYKVDDNLSGIEDDFFVAGCIARSSRLYVEEKIFYHAYDRVGSATHSKHPDYYAMMDRALPYYKQMMTYGTEEMKRDLQRAVIDGILNGVENVLDKIFFPTYYYTNRLNISSEKKVLLYGAGNVGECFYQQITNKKMFSIVDWVDKNLEISSKTGVDLIKPADICKCEYDYILIAVLYESNAMSIADDLIKLNVPKEKIIWEKPIKVTELLGL